MIPAIMGEFIYHEKVSNLYAKLVRRGAQPIVLEIITQILPKIYILIATKMRRNESKRDKNPVTPPPPPKTDTV